MVGGTVVETIIVPAQIENDVDELRFGMELEARVWVNVRDRGDECAVFVADSPAARSISEGDTLWWQGGEVFWTPKSRAFADKPLRRIGCSGVARPTDAARAATTREG
jgi:hypothetical protein